MEIAAYVFMIAAVVACAFITLASASTVLLRRADYVRPVTLVFAVGGVLIAALFAFGEHAEVTRLVAWAALVLGVAPLAAVVIRF